MNRLEELFKKNQEWSSAIIKEQPDFFKQLSKQHVPEYLWIGCSDARVPSNQIVGLMPGELFVHRNVANVVVYSDLNCLSVIQFAVDVLKVKHIIVCGHYGCAGVKAAVCNESYGLVDNWLRHIQDIHHKHQSLMQKLDGDVENLHSFMCEMNAIEQMVNVCQTTIVQDAWKRGQNLSVHAWVYGLKDGLVHSLAEPVDSKQKITANFEDALARLEQRIDTALAE